jgi:hypothetical protein
LGFIIEAGKGIRTDPEKVKAILEWATPTTVKAVRSFLGFANFYRRFIRNFSAIVAPLTDLTRKDHSFRWTDKAERAFQHLKKLFTTAPILMQFDPDRETILEADSSGWSTGGVLSQYDDDGLLRPCAYFSRKNSPAECNYKIYDKELLAIIRCLGEWETELASVQEFKIITDHKNLEYFTTLRRLSERQMRWVHLLSRFKFTISYRPGAQAARPDALSRRQQDLPEGEEDERLAHRELQLFKPEIFENAEHGAVFAIRVSATGTAEGPSTQADGNEEREARPVDTVEEPLENLWTREENQDEVLKKLKQTVRDPTATIPFRSRYQSIDFRMRVRRRTASLPGEALGPLFRTPAHKNNPGDARFDAGRPSGPQYIVCYSCTSVFLASDVIGRTPFLSEL